IEQADLVDAAGVVVGAAQDPDPAIVLVRGQADVRVGRNHRLSVRTVPVKVGRIEFIASAQRRARELVTTKDVVLVTDTVGVPVLDVHLYLARDLVAAVALPGRYVPEPHEAVEIRILADIARPVLEAEEVARGALTLAGGGAAEAHDRPACGRGPGVLGDPGQVSHR